MRKYALLLLFSVFYASVLFGENTGPAILSKGPVPHAGIEFLGVNAIASQYGEYRYGEEKIIVYYTTESIYFSDKWKSFDCGIFNVMQRDSDGERKIIAYTDKKGWTAFLSFRIESDYICNFLESYQRRQSYFLNIARDKTVFSFPAILDLESSN